MDVKSQGVASCGLNSQKLNSFGKQYRLLSSGDFDYLKTGCSNLNTKFVRAYYKPGKSSDSSTRIGISVSKKVGKAKIRNKFKRQIREQFRVSNLKNRGLDVLFVVSPRVTSSFPDDKDAEKELKKSIYGLLQKLNNSI